MNNHSNTSRSLGLLAAVVPAVTGWAFLLRSIPGAWIFSFPALLVLVVTLFLPEFFRVPQKIVARGIGFLFHLLATLFFSTVYLFLILPLALGRRLFSGGDITPAVIGKSYWKEPEKTRYDSMRW